jgi:hypothetical protein
LVALERVTVIIFLKFPEFVWCSANRFNIRGWIIFLQRSSAGHLSTKYKSEDITTSLGRDHELSWKYTTNKVQYQSFSFWPLDTK